MGLGVRPEAHAAAFDALGQPPQIALEGVEIDDQCRGVDLIEAHANLGGWARRHRSSPALGDRRRLAHGLGKCNTPGASPAARLKPTRDLHPERPERLRWFDVLAARVSNAGG